MDDQHDQLLVTAQNKIISICVRQVLLRCCCYCIHYRFSFTIITIVTVVFPTFWSY